MQHCKNPCIEYFIEGYSQSINIVFPGTAGSDITAVLPGVNQSFPSDVEAEANSYFQKIYNQPPNPTMTIDEVLEMLKKFKDSTSKKEKVNFLFYAFPCL